MVVVVAAAVASGVSRLTEGAIEIVGVLYY